MRSPTRRSSTCSRTPLPARAAGDGGTPASGDGGTIEPANALLDIGFGATTTTKTGAAVIGKANDRGNAAGQAGQPSAYDATSLFFAEGAAAPSLSMRVEN